MRRFLTSARLFVPLCEQLSGGEARSSLKLAVRRYFADVGVVGGRDGPEGEALCVQIRSRLSAR